METLKKEMIELFERTNRKFLSKETELILSNVNERSMCGALSQQFLLELSHTKYRDYHVDVEYNRNYDGKLKTIKNGHEKVININCDIIIHSRGENIRKDNLIAIEMKKSNSKKSDKESDKERLIALTKDSYDDIWSYDGKTLPEHVCGYELGVYYEINIRRRNITLEFYMNGKLDESKSMEF
jgi:hypothetical protein